MIVGEINSLKAGHTEILKIKNLNLIAQMLWILQIPCIQIMFYLLNYTKHLILFWKSFISKIAGKENNLDKVKKVVEDKIDNENLILKNPYE